MLGLICGGRKARLSRPPHAPPPAAPKSPPQLAVGPLNPRRFALQTGRPKLLLADDSLTYRKVISLTFADEGMEVVTASDGEEALRLLEAGTPPDIVLADAVMGGPGPDGYQLCERVKRDERLRHVPVILLVGRFEPFNEAEARRVGADTFLTKPFQPIRDLIHKVGSLLGGGEQKSAPEQEPAADAGAGGETGAQPPSFRAAGAPGLTQDSDARPHADAHAVAEDASAPFADFDADDEMIEAVPADAFTPATAAVAAEEAREAPAFSGHDARPSFEPSRVAEPSFAPAAHAPSAAHFAASAQPQSAFNAPAPAAVSTDDALLDLDDDAAPAQSAAAPAADSDNFILDLDDNLLSDLHTPETPGAAEPEPSVFGAKEVSGAQPDAAGAFAEAAHGDAAAPEEMTSETTDDLATSDTGGRHDFIEPTVEPAEAPVPAQVEGEFTDGSVEGDLPKPPAAGFVASSGSAPAASAEPSTEGFAVGEARVGIDERPAAAAAGRLSPEEVDAIARRVVELMSDRVVREIAWEVVPELAERLTRRKLEEERGRD